MMTNVLYSLIHYRGVFFQWRVVSSISDEIPVFHGVEKRFFSHPGTQ